MSPTWSPAVFLHSDWHSAMNPWIVNCFSMLRDLVEKRYLVDQLEDCACILKKNLVIILFVVMFRIHILSYCERNGQPYISAYKDLCSKQNFIFHSTFLKVLFWTAPPSGAFLPHIVCNLTKWCSILRTEHQFCFQWIVQSYACKTQQ